MGPSRILIPVVTPSEEFAFRFGKNNQGRGEHEREIKRLRPAMAVPASHLETEIERPDIAEAGSTAQLSAGLSNWTAVCARGNARPAAQQSYFRQPHRVPESNPNGSVTLMEWDIFKSEDGSGNWVVQAMDFDGDGEIYTVIFSDFDAKARAREYYNWKTEVAGLQAIHAVKSRKTTAAA